jgi:hypothetical protein
LTTASTLAGWRRSGAGPSTRRALALIFAGAFACTFPPDVAQPERIQRVALSDPYITHIVDAARRFRLPEHWIRSVMEAESASDPRAISSKGAMGLMQIMPMTWNELRVRHGLGHDPFEPRDNILAGAAYIRELFDRYGSPGFLAAYNAGPARYEASLAGRPLPTETRTYIASIAPMIDSVNAAKPVVLATAGTHAWTRAPLFVAQPERSSAVVPVFAAKGSNDRPGAKSDTAKTPSDVRDLSGIVPQSAGLFVARINTETQR